MFLIRILKDGANQDGDISCQGGPLLLQAIISQSPNVFSPHPVISVAESYQDPQGKSEKNDTTALQASGKNTWRLKFWQKSPIGNLGTDKKRNLLEKLSII